MGNAGSYAKLAIRVWHLPTIGEARTMTCTEGREPSGLAMVSLCASSVMSAVRRLMDTR